MEMGCLVMVGELKGVDTRLLNHHAKKGNMMVVMIDLDQNLLPSTASFGASVSINNLMPFNNRFSVTINYIII